VRPILFAQHKECSTLESVLLEVGHERIRQEEKFGPDQTCASEGMSLCEKLAVLAEEFGEVSRLTVDLTWPDGSITDSLARLSLRAELIQVAAVAAAWAESL